MTSGPSVPRGSLAVPLLVLLRLLSAASALGQAAVSPNPPAAAAEPASAARRIQADVRHLASDELKGRRAGTPEGEAAARFMADSYRKAGLLPGGEKGTYFQTFDFVDGVDLGPRNSLSTRGAGEVGRTWRLEEEFHPLDFSASGQADGEVVFGGYGIVSTDLGWDDYAGIDVKGKVVLVLRTSPDGVDERSPFSPAMALRTKAARARERGAKAAAWPSPGPTRRSAMPGSSPSR